MRRKNSLIIPAVLAFSLCTVTAVPVLAEDAAQTEAEADTASDEASDAAEDTADTPYEKGTITETDYQSEWLNLKFTPPETVVMNTEEELCDRARARWKNLPAWSLVRMLCPAPFMK